MTQVPIMRSAGDLGSGSPDSVSSIDDLVDRIIAIAGQVPNDLVDTMATGSGAALTCSTIVESKGTDPDAFLRSWDSIGRASPAALTDAQYNRFLQGEHPVTLDSSPVAFDLYGAGVPANR